MPHLDFAAYLIDLIGTLSFAVAGAMVAADRRMDLFGVLSMGIVTAMGGGVMRDCLLGQFPARNFYSYDYICFALAASLVVFIMVRALHEVGYTGDITLEADQYLSAYTDDGIYDGILELSRAARRLVDMYKSL